jgi:predicted Zn-dependent peptidase
MPSILAMRFRSSLTSNRRCATRMHGRPPFDKQSDPRVYRERLKNGLRLVVVPLPNLYTAAIGVFIKVGSRFENKSNNGLSHFLEHMLFRGTERHPSAYALNLAVEELGARAYGTTHADLTRFELAVPPENIAPAMAILGDLLRSPIFSDVEVEKSIIRQEILESLDEQGRNVSAEDLSRQALFGPDPLGFTIAGTLAHLKRLRIEDLREHMQRYYVANNMVLSVVGAVDPKEVFALADARFSGLPPGQAAVWAQPSIAVDGVRFRYVESPGSQTDLRLAFRTFGEADPRRMALHLLTRVIDDGMSTRLQRRICDEQGLAYEVYALLDQYQDCGVFGVGAAVEHGKMFRLVEQVLTLLGELTEQKVEPSELSKAQRRYQWDLQATLDNAEALCTHYGARELFDLESGLSALAEESAQVSGDDLLSVARDIFRPEQLVVACVGMLNKRLKKQVESSARSWVVRR